MACIEHARNHLQEVRVIGDVRMNRYGDPEGRDLCSGGPNSRSWGDPRSWVEGVAGKGDGVPPCLSVAHPQLSAVNNQRE
jgi:hypothetical protein